MDSENDSGPEDFAVVEKPTMVTSTCSVTQKSLYGQVVFHDLPDVYPTDCDIKCRYSLTGEVSPQPGDKIALFKVGWLSVSEYITYEWAQIPSGTHQTVLQVNFKEDTLPKEEEDMYQLCYVTSGNVIAGASTPFGFRKPHESELVAMEDPGDPGLLVFRSGITQLQEALNKVIEERDMIQEKFMDCEELLKNSRATTVLLKEAEIKYLEQIDLLQAERVQAVVTSEAPQEKENNPYEDVIMALRNELASAEMSTFSLKEKLREKEEQLRMNEKTIECLKQDINQVEENLKENGKTVEELKRGNAKLKEQLEETNSHSKEAEEDFEKLIKSLESGIEEKNDRITQLSSQAEEFQRTSLVIKENENLIQELTERLQAYSCTSIEETVILKTEVDKLKQELSKREETNRGLETENKKLSYALNEIKKSPGDNWKSIMDTVTGLLNGLSGIQPPEECYSNTSQPSTSVKLTSVIQEKSGLRSEVIQVKHENQELNRILLEIREENAALKSRIGVLEVELRTTKAGLTTSCKPKELGVDMEKFIEHFSANVQSLEKLNCLISEKLVLQEILEEEKANKVGLRKKVEDLLRCNSTLYGELQQAREESDSLRNEIKDWKMSPPGESITLLRSVLDSLECEKRETENSLSNTLRDKESLERQLLWLRSETVGRITFVDDKPLRQEIERLKTKLESKTCCKWRKDQLHQACLKYSQLYQILSSLPGLEVLYGSEILKPPATSFEETLSARLCPLCSVRLVTSFENYIQHIENHCS